MPNPNNAGSFDSVIQRMMSGMDKTQSNSQNADVDRRIASEEDIGGQFSPEQLEYLRSCPLRNSGNSWECRIHRQ